MNHPQWLGEASQQGLNIAFVSQTFCGDSFFFSFFKLFLASENFLELVWKLDSKKADWKPRSRFCRPSVFGDGGVITDRIIDRQFRPTDKILVPSSALGSLFAHNWHILLSKVSSQNLVTWTFMLQLGWFTLNYRWESFFKLLSFVCWFTPTGMTNSEL